MSGKNYWCVYNLSNEVIFNTISETRKQAISKFNDGQHWTWDEAHREGYECEQVTINKVTTK